MYAVFAFLGIFMCVTEVQLYSVLAFFVNVLQISIISGVAIYLIILSLSFGIELVQLVSSSIAT